MNMNIMKYSFLSLMSAALLAVSCSESDSMLPAGQAHSDGITPVPINFGVYVQRGMTRAGASGDLTTTALTTTAGDLKNSGFGVFAYYTDHNRYSQSAQANFMYNQQVTAASAALFSYSPMKYWPNEFMGANADEDDKVSFFAYAPYVDVYRTSGLLDGSATVTDPAGGSHPALANATEYAVGITGLTDMAVTGDPMVHYVVATDLSKGVDLCWGTVKDNPSDAAAAPYPTTASWGPAGSEVTITEGMPWLNLTRAKTTTDKVNFYFRHALAKLNVQVDAEVDESSDESSPTPMAAGTKVYVRQVSFRGFTMEGTLNLNNLQAKTPRWVGYQGCPQLSHETVVFNDGRLDGREGRVADNIEVNQGINPVLVQSGDWGSTAGVLPTAVNLFQPTPALSAKDQLHQAAYVIPTGDPVDVEILYDIETADDLAGTLSDGKTPGISIENRSALTEILDKLEAGKNYTIRLHLGLNSVRFDVTVEDDWDIQNEKTYQE